MGKVVSEPSASWCASPTRATWHWHGSQRRGLASCAFSTLLLMTTLASGDSGDGSAVAPAGWLNGFAAATARLPGSLSVLPLSARLQAGEELYGAHPGAVSPPVCVVMRFTCFSTYFCRRSDVWYPHGQFMCSLCALDPIYASGCMFWLRVPMSTTNDAHDAP